MIPRVRECYAARVRQGTCVILGLLVVTWMGPISPATIPVSRNCTLAAAIEAANNDDDSGGACASGEPGPDVIVLGDDVLLTEVVAVDGTAPIGLPIIRSEITIDGQSFSIVRDDDAPEFRILHVSPAVCGPTISLH